MNTLKAFKTLLLSAMTGLALPLLAQSDTMNSAGTTVKSIMDAPGDTDTVHYWWVAIIGGLVVILLVGGLIMRRRKAALANTDADIDNPSSGLNPF